MSPRNLQTEFAVLQPDLQMDPVNVTPTLFEELGQRFDGFKGRVLVSAFQFDSDWPQWERHPAGDELVCLLSGEAELLLHLEGGVTTLPLREPCSYVVVPKGTWHTARIRATPTRMLFITPGEGTENGAPPVVPLRNSA